MVVHASAFLVYILMFFVTELIIKATDRGSNDLFYVHWFICTIFGVVSYVCLFIVLWHLGTKTQKLEFMQNRCDQDSASGRS